MNKILIVDDDPFMCELLAAILEEEGYTVSSAEDGTSAFSAFCADAHLGLLISDMNMPDFSGLELLQKIRARGSKIPAIILSGDEDLAHNPALIKANCEILVKDENVQENIGAFVAAVLHKHQLR